MRKTMKALVKKKAEPGLWLDEVPVPSVGINDVLIRVDRTGICGTDLHIYQWDAWAQRTIPVPMVVGHEFVGEVVEVGSNVADFFPGDVVSGEGHVVCGRCRNCLAGRRHLCKDTKGVGVNRPGAFAEYLVLPMTNVWLHKREIDRDVASIFDPFGNAVHTALAFPVLGEDVLITGAGPIGIMAAAIMPMGPAPVMSTSSPSTRNSSAVCAALPKGSRIAAMSLGMSSATFQTLVTGKARYSAKAPGRLTPNPRVSLQR